MLLLAELDKCKNHPFKKEHEQTQNTTKWDVKCCI